MSNNTEMYAMLSQACPRCGQRPYMGNAKVRARYRWELWADVWLHRCCDLLPDDPQVQALPLYEWEEKKAKHIRLQPIMLRCDWMESGCGYEKPCDTTGCGEKTCHLTEITGIEVGGIWAGVLPDFERMVPGCIGRLVPDGGG